LNSNGTGAGGAGRPAGGWAWIRVANRSVVMNVSLLHKGIGCSSWGDSDWRDDEGIIG